MSIGGIRVDLVLEDLMALLVSIDKNLDRIANALEEESDEQV